MSGMNEATIDPSHLLTQLENILESDPQMYTVTVFIFNFNIVLLVFSKDLTSKMMILFYLYNSFSGIGCWEFSPYLI